MGEAESQETFEELENYIFSRERRDRNSHADLPLLKQTIREKRKNKRRKRIKSRSGCFPTGIHDHDISENGIPYTAPSVLDEKTCPQLFIYIKTKLRKREKWKTFLNILQIVTIIR